MQTYLSDIIPSISRYSKQLNDETLLTSRHWVVVEELENRKSIYIFRKNRDLLISTNGSVEKGTWDYLGNDKLLIEKDGKAFLFRHGFFEDDFLVLKIEGGDEYAFLVNENKYDENLNSVLSIHTFLTKKYLYSPGTLPNDEWDSTSVVVVVGVAIVIFFFIIIILES